MKKYRVFDADVFWSKVMFLFPDNLSFTEIKHNPKSSFLTKTDYVGTFDFDEKFLEKFDSQKINGENYYFSYHIPNNEAKEFTKFEN